MIFLRRKNKFFLIRCAAGIYKDSGKKPSILAHLPYIAFIFLGRMSAWNGDSIMSLHVEHSSLGSYGYAMYASVATSQLFASYLPSTLGETITVLNLGIISVGTTLLALRQKKVQQDRDERLKDEAAQREYVANQVLSLHGKLDTATTAATEAQGRAENERLALKEQIESLTDAVRLKEQQLVEMVSKLGKPEPCPHNKDLQCVQIPASRTDKKSKPK